ncbi:MAG: radical SAM protein [Pirellulales bacterium]|nr:radical SAM protein [Pirellulales bacterium]
MAFSVALADLRHNYGGVLATDCMPLGIGYIKAVMDRDLPGVSSSLHAYPDTLLAELLQSPPDVLMLSNYVWNEALSLRFARLAKTLRPDTLVVMGGPNIPNEPERQIEFLAARPELDAYLLGEGDFLATEIVARYLAVDACRARLGEDELHSSVYRRPDGAVVRGAPHARHRHVDEIPSPWLTGIMDHFFDGKLAPMIETNRGCPFRCSFCVQGQEWYTKVHNFSTERLLAELDRIAELIQRRSPQMGTLRIADANYGMYERDVDISRHIGRIQQRTGWPTFIDATTGKNRADRILQSLEQVNGALVLYQAVQSLDEEVLRNVRRSSIKLAAYEQIQIYMRGRGLRSSSDLILGLPGESLATHTAGLFRMLDAGTDQMHCFQAMMLKGSELEELRTREQFHFETRFRVLPKNFGVYADERVFDIEEIIVATDTLPFEDYIRARKLHLAFSIFWNDGWFAPLLQVVQREGIAGSAWLQAMLDAMIGDRGVVGRLLDEFETETRNELFDTRDACAAFYAQDDNFARLQRGEIGDNLMYKYRARASFFDWVDVCALAVQATAQLLADTGGQVPEEHATAFWRDVGKYVELRHASGQHLDEVLAPQAADFSYDIMAWLETGRPRDAAAFRLAQPRRYEFELTPEGARELSAAFQVWESKMIGLSKLVTRIRVHSQVRQPRAVEPAAAALEN